MIGTTTWKQKTGFMAFGRFCRLAYAPSIIWSNAIKRRNARGALKSLLSTPLNPTYKNSLRFTHFFTLQPAPRMGLWRKTTFNFDKPISYKIVNF